MTVTTTGTDKAALLKDLKKLVVDLEDDLRSRSMSEEEFRTRLDREWREAKEARRTALSYPAWRDERVTQAAVAWVLGCVFVRFCEDNGLIDEPFLAGPGERLAEAESRHEAHFRTYPHHNNRDWLIEAFRHLASTNETAAGLFDERHNPLWGLTPGYETATELLMFWRRWGADGEIRYDFTDPEWDTRFLGDLYQDLSEHARKTYALLQTPEFVEEFILDLTLEPAVADDGQGFGLNPAWTGPDGRERRGLRTIDPACGSGHFLLGIFHRLLDKWRQAEPGTDAWTLVRRVLESVHGCDKNPFAASIARFRLLVAAMRAAGARRLADAPPFPINVAVGDSLLHGRDAAGIQTDLDTLFAEAVVGREEGEAYAYATEDVWEYAKRVDLLGRGSYHVVVGNPPYITVKDKQENENYRAAYDACAGTYALSVPFAQRMFELAVKGPGGRLGGGGFVGQITANSFMKREFGKKLIEVFFRNKAELSHVIDTSGAYIPGHGTPTVILVGRNRVPSPDRTVRAVLGVRGEPSQPEKAEYGVVWQEIAKKTGLAGTESEWISVVDATRHSISVFPWSLSGGGAGEVQGHFEAAAVSRLGDRCASIGRTTASGADDAYFLPDRRTAERLREGDRVRELVTGDTVRDFSFGRLTQVRNPYADQANSLPVGESDPLVARSLWPFRALLERRVIFGKKLADSDAPWYVHLENYSSKLSVEEGLGFAFVATHNHFSYDRAGRLFNRTAPVIKLPEGASEDEHLELLGVLNSSAACFWLKQVSHDKGSQGVNEGFKSQEWERFYEFTGTKLQEFPLPAKLPLHLGRVLDDQAQRLAGVEPSAVAATAVPTRQVLDDAEAAQAKVRRRMIALQEELDWQVYGLYGLLSDREVARTVTPSPDPETIPEVKLGERAFEIALARKAEAGEAETAWFTRHHSNPVTEIPAHWPGWYREIVQARIDLITSRKDIALIERPECKRRWASDPWEKKERSALRAWLLDRCEDEDLWFEAHSGMRYPRTLTVNNLADRLDSDPDFTAVAALYAADHLKKPDLPLAQILTEIIADEHVPYLAAMRYKDSGLRTRREWEKVWEKQREEDRTGARLDIDPPTKYKSSDFLRPSYWSHRGKLDVPKERFISYPEAGPDSDSTLMLGWAGWDHKDQALALTQLIDTRVRSDAWGAERLVPLLAGLHEVMPWVRQWYSAYDDEWEGSPAEDLEAEFQRYLRTHGVSEAQMRDWRPVRKTRGRKPAQRKETPEQSELDDE
ncbi:BREX-2 system adenine-specific DNA-methyltransferase PglX [Streptomyces griseoaurantiacus]|uniref:site-specific DNA-methyltransferase (adenine-specific) n=1 Tax=Streptomyces griseoaurantiacus TaxID=68213 RepID=A0A7W2DRD2_9ACTN|nr:BREX-2 system adenine-specific DNA-methyltransferase PglX [Streptomyces griseoaurantiacus]MBA5221626.1 BREX-2 system adenine-specific DNA-methyltransferase PglX [Streptomyces griseoaurantiacus]